MNAVAVILAAGEAKRMGHPKALIEHEGGRSFLQSLSSTFGKAGCRVLGVVGRDADAVRAQHPAVELVDAPAWQEGVLATIKAGLRAALDEGADAVLVHPVDMPTLRATTLKSLLKSTPDGTGLRPEFEGAPGFPLILSRQGAQQLLAAQGGTLEPALGTLALKRVTVKDPGVVVNINAPDVYERLFGSAPKLAPPPKRRTRKGDTSAES